MGFRLSYLYIGLLLLEGPLVTIVGLRGIHYIVAALMIAIVLANIGKPRFKKAFFCFPMLVWGLWILYSIINWNVFNHFSMPEIANPGSINFIIRKLVAPLFLMGLVYYEASYDLSRLLKFILGVLTIYVLLGMLFQTAVTGADTDERGGDLLGNSLPLNVVIFFFVAALSYFKKVISIRLLIIIGFLALAAILFGATRKAFGGWLIIVFFVVLGRSDFNKPKYYFLLALFFILGYYFMNYMFENTLLGERMMLIEESSNKYNTTDNAFLDLMGDRAFFYILGFDLFLQNPINGIGLTNFPVITNTELAIHSEYIVQLCECGILGSSLYLLFIGSLVFIIFKAIKSKKGSLGMICIGGLLSILFISFFSWTYSIPRYFLVFGVILAVCRPLESTIQEGVRYR